MKIITRAEMIKMPVGTLYARYQPCCFDALMIKGESIDIDWYEQQLIGDFTDSDGSEDFLRICDEMQAGESHTVDFAIQGREALFDDEQLYAVFEPDDLDNLIKRLQMAQQGIEP